ncbi:hypothetical protein L1887_27254 [Cichorium endivia]|nr:hypothetical protein L1887_27254 [Cichorium endivia]
MVKEGGRRLDDDANHWEMKTGEKLQEKTRNGLNYAFIRFRDVQDEEDFERRISDVKFKGMNLIINIAKYDGKGESYSYKTRNVKIAPPRSPPSNGLRDCRSYAEILRPEARPEENPSNQAPPSP